jgi:hypothetical protein
MTSQHSYPMLELRWHSSAPARYSNFSASFAAAVNIWDIMENVNNFVPVLFAVADIAEKL